MRRFLRVLRLVTFFTIGLVGLFVIAFFIFSMADCFGWEEAPVHRCTVCRIDNPDMCATHDGRRDDHDAAYSAAIDCCNRIRPHCGQDPVACPCWDQIDHLDQYFTAHCVPATIRYRRYERYWQFSFGWK
jgi:hypothetical protein